MNNIPDQLISDVRDALSSFLATLLGGQAPIQVGTLEAGTWSTLKADATAGLAILGLAGPDHRFAVVLDDQWVPLLSKAMLGQAMQADDPGAGDLVSELASQGYGTVRNQLAGDLILPDATFQVVPAQTPLPDDALPNDLWRISFSMTTDDAQPAGSILFSQAIVYEEAAPPEEITLGASGVEMSHASFPDLGANPLLAPDSGNFQLLAEVELEVTVELGRRKLPLSHVLRLTTGSVIELEKLVGEPLEIYANGRLIAEGEAVVIDEQFGVRVTNLASNRHSAKAFF